MFPLRRRLYLIIASWWQRASTFVNDMSTVTRVVARSLCDSRVPCQSWDVRALTQSVSLSVCLLDHWLLLFSRQSPSLCVQHAVLMSLFVCIAPWIPIHRPVCDPVVKDVLEDSVKGVNFVSIFGNVKNLAAVIIFITTWYLVSGDRLYHLLWSPYAIGQTIIFLPRGFFFLSSSLFSSPNLSRRRLDVYHTSTHGVALVRI